MNSSAAAGGDGMSWATAFNDLQNALDIAVSGDEVWVAAGTYTPSKSIDDSPDPRTAAFILKSGVKIYGGFVGNENQLHKRQTDPSVTVLSGDIGTVGDDTDNSYHVVYAYGVTDAVLDGFTVTLGRGEGTPYSCHDGAGMYNYESSLTIANCTFKDNQVAVRTSDAFGRGGGMYNYNSAPIVRNCTFIGNRAGEGFIRSKGNGGGMYNEGHFGSELDPQWPVIIGCTFSDNQRSSSNLEYSCGGGGMYNFDCSPTVDRCTFAGNSARVGHGGAMLNYGSKPIIANCIFTANQTGRDRWGGAIFNFGSDAKILNCTFYRNGWSSTSPEATPVTLHGGAIAQIRHGGTIANNLFVENASNGNGGAIYFDPSFSLGQLPSLYNCLFYENIKWNPTYWDFVKYSSHVYGDINNDSVDNLYDIDPLLVDPASGDFRLRYDSPGIDSGTTLKFAKQRWLPMPVKDFYGNKRIVDGDGDGVPAADIGVHEFTPNLPDLRAFLQALADSGDLDEATAARLLAYVDAALAESARNVVTTILNVLSADAEAALGDTETAQLIVRKTNAVMESLD